MNVPQIASTSLLLFEAYHALKLLLAQEPKSASKQTLSHLTSDSRLPIQVDSVVHSVGRNDLAEHATVASARKQVDQTNNTAVVLHPALAAIYGSPQTV